MLSAGGACSSSLGAHLSYMTMEDLVVFLLLLTRGVLFDCLYNHCVVFANRRLSKQCVHANQLAQNHELFNLCKSSS